MLSSRDVVSFAKLVISLIPVYLFSTLYTALLIPYFRQVLLVSDFELILTFGGAMVGVLLSKIPLICLGYCCPEGKNNATPRRTLAFLSIVIWIFASIMLSIIPILNGPSPMGPSSGAVYGAIAFYVSIEAISFAYTQELCDFFFYLPYENRWFWQLGKWVAMTLGTGMGIGTICAFPDPLGSIHLISAIGSGVLLVCFVGGLGLPGLTKCCNPGALYKIFDHHDMSKENMGYEIAGGRCAITFVPLFAIFVAISIGSLLYFVTDWSASRVHFFLMSDSTPDSYDMNAATLDFTIFFGFKVGICFLACLICHFFRLRCGLTPGGGFYLVWGWCLLGLIVSVVLFVLSALFQSIPWIATLIALSIWESLLGFGSEDLWNVFIGRKGDSPLVKSFFDEWLSFLALCGHLAQLLGAIISLLTTQLASEPLLILHPVFSAASAMVILVVIMITAICCIDSEDEQSRAALLRTSKTASAKPIIFSRKAIKLL
jgi:hypothetical protein